MTSSGVKAAKTNTKTSCCRHETDKVAASLAAKGLRITKQRVAILKVMQNERETALSAHKIYQLVKKISPGTNFSTIYRNLELLVDLDVLSVIPLDGSRTYTLMQGQGHQHHLICITCGAVRRIDHCPIKQLHDKDLAGFQPTAHRFEVFGYCSSCQTT